MRAHLTTVAWLLFVWLALVGDVSVRSVLIGLLIAAGLVTFFRPTRSEGRRIAVRPVGVLRFAAFFVVQFIEANIQVALAVINPERVRYQRAIVAVPIAAANDVSVILLANAISLTPGTFIVEMRREPATIYVHVLQMPSVRETRLMILRLERYIVTAFESPGGLERVEELMRQAAAEETDTIEERAS